jgi:hypothetical protein
MPAVVCTVPSGNLNPPSVASIMPTTVNLEVGVSVPMPTSPVLLSKMLESPMNELLLVSPVHFVSRPMVPLPTTCRFAPAAISETCAGLLFASEFLNLIRAGLILKLKPCVPGTRGGAKRNAVGLARLAI